MPKLDVPPPVSPLCEPLAALRPLIITEVSTPAGAPQRPLFEALLHHHHYLSCRSTVGENLQYLVCDWRCRPLDLYHADEHLWTVASELYGRGTPEARAWVAPLLQQIRDDQTTQVIATLTELKPRLLEAQQEKLQTQIKYVEHNLHLMNCKDIIAAREAAQGGTATVEQLKLANQPLGSGAIESTCRQYQCRFKRTGQFWTTAGDEALLCLETFWRNNWWHELYPHAQPACTRN